MAIITKGTVEKGTEAQFTLDKAELAADTLVAADAYFADDANWANVILEYKSDVGGQSKRVVFDATQATPTADFLASDTARDVFEIKRLVIVDHDGGKFTLNRANLTTAEFDLDFTAPSYDYLSYNLSNGPTGDAFGGVSGGAGADLEMVKSTTDQTLGSGDYWYVFSIKSADVVDGLAFGTCDNATLSLVLDDGFDGFDGVASSGLNYVVFNNYAVVTTVTRPVGDHTFELKRVSGSLAYILDGSTIYTEAVNTGTVTIPIVRNKTGEVDQSYFGE